MITDTLKTAFQSKRLIYRAVENNEHDRHFLHTEIENNAANAALSDLALIKPRSEKRAEDFIQGLSKSTMAVMICLPSRETDDAPTPIGFIVLGWGGTDPEHARHSSTGIGIALAESRQGHGYGGEAIDWVLDWAFRHGGYHRVGIRTVSYNERAQHLYKKLGFVEEGRSRESHWFDRKWYDTISYGMLEREWAELRGLEQ